MLVISRRFRRRIRVDVPDRQVYVSILGYRNRTTGEFNIAVEDDLGMMVFARKAGERVEVGPDAHVSILGPHNNRKNEYNIGIDAPKSIRVLREEVVDRYDPDYADRTPGVCERSDRVACTLHTPDQFAGESQAEGRT